jgi:hypothetical protein
VEKGSMTEVRPDWKPTPSEPKPYKPLKRGFGFRQSQATLASDFRFAVLHEFGGRCILADLHDCDGELDPAHIIPKQTLRKLGLPEVVVFDHRNGVAACRKAHRRNDTGLERFPRELLPPSAFEFAKQHKLEHLIEKLYPDAVVSQ